MPNTLYRYRFRAVTDAGEILGPEAEHRVTDERVAWRSLSGDGVRLWWHEGDEAFAERALGIAEEALASASVLLGSERGAPVDVFVYGDARTFRSGDGSGDARERRGPGPSGDPDPLRAHRAIADRLGLGRGARPPRAHAPRLRRCHEQPVRVPAALAQRGRRGLPVARVRRRRPRPGRRRGPRGHDHPARGARGAVPDATRPVRPRLRRERLGRRPISSSRYGEEALGAIVDGYAVRPRRRRRVPTGDRRRHRRRSRPSWLEAMGSPPIEPTGPRPAPPGPVPEAWRSDPVPLIR